MHQNVHQSAPPMIPIPQQLTLSPSEHHPMYDQSHLQQQQQLTPMNTRRGRASVDAQNNSSMSTPTPERKSRSRSKNPSMDSRPVEMPVQESIPATVDIPSDEMIVPPVASESVFDHSSSINNTREVNPFVSKSNDEDHQTERDEKEREDRGDSRSPSVDSSSAKSESVIKEIPLSGERHRLSRSKSPKSRWHHSPSPQDQHTHPPTTIEEEQHSATINDNEQSK